MDAKPFIVSLAHAGTDIDLFMSYYRESFPHATVTPKLHMLEDHVVPFLVWWAMCFKIQEQIFNRKREKLHSRSATIHSRSPQFIQDSFHSLFTVQSLEPISTNAFYSGSTCFLLFCVKNRMLGDACPLNPTCGHVIILSFEPHVCMSEDQRAFDFCCRYSVMFVLLLFCVICCALFLLLLLKREVWNSGRGYATMETAVGRDTDDEVVSTKPTS